jgi:hypothetical protein
MAEDDLDAHLRRIWPLWQRVQRRQWKRSPQRLREIVDALCEQVTASLEDEDLPLTLRKAYGRALRRLARLTTRLDAYTESTAERAARRRQSGIARLKKKAGLRRHGRTLDDLRDMVLAVNDMLGDLTQSALTKVLDHRARLSAGGTITSASRRKKSTADNQPLVDCAATYRQQHPTASRLVVSRHVKTALHSPLTVNAIYKRLRKPLA